VQGLGTVGVGAARLLDERGASVVASGVDVVVPAAVGEVIAVDSADDVRADMVAEGCGS